MMDWDNIEAKWVAMTRRVRGDFASEKTAAEKTEIQHVTRLRPSSANMSDRQATGLAETLAKPLSE